MEQVKELLTYVGGIAVVVTGTLAFCKSIIEKFVTTAIEKTANKELERTKSKLSRNMYAFEFLLNKEFEYYQLIDKIYAELIVDVQDLYWNMFEAEGVDFERRCSRLKEISIKILEYIPELKNHNFVHQVYVPLDIFKITNEVVMSLQNNAGYVTCAVASFFGKEDIEEERIRTFKMEVLETISMANAFIRTRMEKLSEG